METARTPHATILIIEDEETIVEFLRTGLRYEGYQVEVAGTGQEGLRKARPEKVDLVILDLMLPDRDGFEVCRVLREGGFDRPIIMLTARKEISDKVKGMDLGADDYITKPFSFDELLARIRVQLRRMGHASEQNKLRAGDIVMDLDTRTVTRAGKEVELTPTEFALLELFLRHPQRVFTRETLLNLVWGYNFVGETNVVDVHVSHLREKLNDRPARLIRTHYGVGYSFHPRAGGSEVGGPGA